MTDHWHVARPGEATCFVCGVDVEDAHRAQSGMKPRALEHLEVTRTYGDVEVQECQRCAAEWPCPAIKAITRNAARARRARQAAR